MPGLKTFINKLYHPDLPFFILIGCCLLAGLFTFLDYGLSHDEPLFYAYADAIGYAYSIPEHLSGEFNLELAYGPSATDHKIYGPAYLLTARNPVALLSTLTGIRRPEFWHLANFITFLCGGLSLYYLCKRWMSNIAAFGAVALFLTQPVFWGHAFINPKDIPFMTFMLAALTLGLKMVDNLVVLSSSAPSRKDNSPQRIHRRFSKKSWYILSFVLGFILLVILFLYSPVREQTSLFIQQAYNAEPSSLLGKLFNSFASRAKDIPVEAYVTKGLVQLDRIRGVLVILTMPLLLISLVGAFRPAFILDLLQKLEDILTPLPTLPQWWVRGQKLKKTIQTVLLPGILLGLVTSIRILGPLAGFLVLLYFLLRYEQRSFASLALYLLVALPVSYLTWPFLWDAPIQRFIEVLRHMANNPQILSVLFNGNIFPSNELPADYLSVMLGITLTLPTLLLIFIGLWAAVVKIKERQVDWRSLSAIALLFFLPFIYILLIKPPMYDGYRHFLFMLPPLFVLVGLGIQLILERSRPFWARSLLLLAITFPGIYGLISTHPYQYTYYNSLVGGTAGAFRTFETDYWLTCYKETMQNDINANPSQFPNIYVLRAPSIAEYYATPQVNVLSYDPQVDHPIPGQKTLLTTRTNVDLTLFPDATILYSVGLHGADFCIVKQNR